MAEQRCIICGNIVKFGHGQRFAECEYCETIQEINSEFLKTAPNEPIIKAHNTLERARKLSVDTVTTSKNSYSAERFVGSSVSENVESLFRDIDDKDEEVWTEEEKEAVNITSKNARIASVMMLVIIGLMLVGGIYGCDLWM